MLYNVACLVQILSYLYNGQKSGVINRKICEHNRRLEKYVSTCGMCFLHHKRTRTKMCSNKSDKNWVGLAAWKNTI